MGTNDVETFNHEVTSDSVRVFNAYPTPKEGGGRFTCAKDNEQTPCGYYVSSNETLYVVSEHVSPDGTVTVLKESTEVGRDTRMGQLFSNAI